MSTRTVPDHQKLYRVAEQQAGHFTAKQAKEAGFTYPLLSYYSKAGDFERVAQGVYRLTWFPEMRHSDLFVAWLRTGLQSVISHESALAVWELSDILPSEIHITISRTASRRRRGIRLHTSHLKPDEITHSGGLPIITVVRTIADVVKSGLAREQAELAIREALGRGLVTRQALQAYARRRGGKVERVIENSLSL